MTQSVVNFVTSLNPVTGSTLPIQSRVFDFEISSNAQAYYNYNMGQIKAVFDKVNGGQAISNADEQQFIQSLNTLNSWSGIKYIDANGVQQPASGTATFVDTNPLTNPISIYSSTGNALSKTTQGTIDTTMNSYMAQALQNVNGLLSSVIGTYNSQNPGNPILDFVHDSTGSIDVYHRIAAGLTVAALSLQNNVYQFDNITAAAIASALNAQLIGNAFTGSTSIQQALAVDFVSRGNEILFNQMTQLNTALNSNQGILGYLNSLQALMNQKDPQLFIKQLGQLSVSNSMLTDSAYNNYESSTYNATLGTQARFAASGQTLSQYEASQGGLAQGAFGNTPSMPTSYTYTAQILISNLTALKDNITVNGGIAPAGQPAPTSQLTQSLQTIINDLQSVPSTDAGVQAWVQDIQSGKEGQFQTSLNNAITAAQSFNDVQRQQLSNVMFVFQQFYQSASSLISNLSNLLQKIASQMNK